MVKLADSIIDGILFEGDVDRPNCTVSDPSGKRIRPKVAQFNGCHDLREARVRGNDRDPAFVHSVCNFERYPIRIKPRCRPDDEHHVARVIQPLLQAASKRVFGTGIPNGRDFLMAIYELKVDIVMFVPRL